MGSNVHVPVLRGPVLDGLNINSDGIYVDGTFGRGGHSSAILDALGANGRLVAIDRDPDAIRGAAAALLDDPRFVLERGEIGQLEAVIGTTGIDVADGVDGILFDLGVSSPQLDDAHRGFSFRHDGPLDMRMDPDSGQSAAAWLARVDGRELMRTIARYGEERHARRIADAILQRRAERPIERTGELASLVASVVPGHGGRRHPATKTFQAIRIAVNDELGQLAAGLEQALRLLRRGGRLSVISFHSLEDRLVKRFMRDASRVAEPWRGMPEIPPEHRASLAVVGRAVSATQAEIDANPRARSARLRTAERL